MAEASKITQKTHSEQVNNIRQAQCSTSETHVEDANITGLDIQCYGEV